MPPVAPVTITTLSSNLFIDIMLRVLFLLGE